MKKSKSDKTILLDMDGVIANFVGAVCNLFQVNEQQNLELSRHQREYRISKILEISESEFWHTIDMQGAVFWAEMPIYKHTPKLVNYIRCLTPDIMISTSPSNSPHCASGKVWWLQNYFGKNFRDYMIGSRKSLMANPNTLLIDDRPENIDSFIKSGGLAVEFPQPWNRSYHSMLKEEYEDGADWAIKEVGRLIAK